MLARPPIAPLRPFIRRVWASRCAPTDPSRAAAEMVLPTGCAHLAIRVEGPPLRVHSSPARTETREYGQAVIGGARAAAYVRDVSAPVASVGAQLQPGAIPALFGVPADALAGSHTNLEDLWGRQVGSLTQELAETFPLEERLRSFERMLMARLPRVCGVHPAVAHALGRFQYDLSVRNVVDEVGFSHRRFATLFARDVGLTPKRFCRVSRFQRALKQIATRGPSAAIAVDAGYFDQPHFNREFREMAGVSPGAYREIGPKQSHHVPVPR